MFIIFIYSILFFISEVLLAIFRRSVKGKTIRRQDRNSLRLFWITIPLSITAAFFLAYWGQWNGLNYFTLGAGLIISFSGVVLRWAAIVQLKKAFTVDVAITCNHRLSTTGLYTFIRHPSYTGLILILLGLGISMNSIFSVTMVFLPVLAALLYRIRVEERLLTDQYGEEYTSYMKRTKKLIPKIF